MPTQNAVFPLKTPWKSFYGAGMAQRGQAPSPFPGSAAPRQDPQSGAPRGTAQNSSCQQDLAAAASGGWDATLHPSVPRASLCPLKATCLKSGAGTTPLGHGTVTPLPPHHRPSLECVLAPSSALTQQLQKGFLISFLILQHVPKVVQPLGEGKAAA